MRGRKRVPEEVRAIEGTTRASHRRKTAAAAESVGTVALKTVEECPGLTPEAKKFWPYFREMFKKLPVVAESDMASLQRMVETYAEIREYMAILKEEGKFYQTYTKSGDMNIKAHPALGAMQDADRRFRAYMTDFGMTPTARTRVGNPGEGNEQKDPLEDFV